MEWLPSTLIDFALSHLASEIALIKRMTLLARRDGTSTSAFRTYWAGNHAQLALSLPGVCKYTQNRVDNVLWKDGSDEPFCVDGIVELFFTDAEIMAVAQASDTGSLLIPEDEPKFLRGWTLCVVETDGPHDHTGVKVLVPIAVQPGIAVTDAADKLRDVTRVVGCTAVSINTVLQNAKRDRLWSEPVPPDLIAVYWFESVNSAVGAFSEHGVFNDVLVDIARKASALRCDPLTIL